jgi:cytidylate kinase
VTRRLLTQDFIQVLDDRRSTNHHPERCAIICSEQRGKGRAGASNRRETIVARSEPTVAISRQRGSGGSFIGQRVAERLGRRYIDRDLLRVAAEYLKDCEVAPAAKAPTFWARLQQAFALGAADGVYCAPSVMAVYEEAVFEVENRLLREIVEGQTAVIVGRGAAQTLRQRPDVVTVFVHAPEQWRVERVQQVYQIPSQDAARQMVLKSDRDRGRIIRSMADIEWTDSRAYDITVNSAAIGFDAAVDLIERAVASRLY